MFGKWKNDILESLIEYKKENGISTQISPEDTYPLHNCIFHLIQSYVWKNEFKNTTLHIADSETPYSWIEIPPYVQHYGKDKVCRIREDFIKLNCFSSHYGYSGYEDDDYIAWSKPKNSASYKLNKPHKCEITDFILNALYKKNSYYSMLLETNPEKQLEHLTSLKKYTIEIFEKLDWNQLEDMTNMSLFDGQHYDKVFGHIYSSTFEHRIHIVAKNALGPIGILSIFNHNSHGVLDNNPNKFSISYVTVSPSYQNQGIASNLYREAIKYAVKNKKYLARTSPSPMGKELSYDSFTKLVQTEFPDVVILSNEESRATDILTTKDSFKNLSYKNRNKKLINFVSELSDTYDYF